MTAVRNGFHAQVADTDLRLLRIFRAVTECGGFAAAEVDLGITRSAISIAMNDLETRLGLTLCQRGRSGFSLTDDGRNVFDAALKLLASVEDFRTRINGLHRWLRGELNIGITDNLVSMPEMVITDSLSALKDRGPDVRINIRMIPPNDIIKAVLEGSLHTGVIPEDRPLPGLASKPLYAETSQLYCARGHPLFESGADSKEELADYHAVTPSYTQSPAIRRYYETLNPSASATDREGIAFLILSGRFIGYLPTHFAERWVRDGYLRTLAPDTCRYQTPYVAIYRKRATENQVLEAYLQELNRRAAVPE